MAIFLRGNSWWMEYRTRSVRRVVRTGFSKHDREKALAAFAAFRLAMGARPKRSAVEGILAAIYDNSPKVSGIPLVGVWRIYEDWCQGKGRKVSHDTWVNRRNLVDRFVTWAADRKAFDITDVSVGLAREYVIELGKTNKNKTQRTYCGYLSQVWDAVGQLNQGVHNPWKAATPDNDGSSVRHEAFTEKQIGEILDEARRVGSDWYLACMIALYTGQRYGDIATLQWGSVKDIKPGQVLENGIVDTAAGFIVLNPSKTRKSSSIQVWIPIAEKLRPILQAGEGFVLPAHGIKYPKPMDIPFSDILKAVGISGSEYGFHSWRHTANSRMADAGIPSETRQMICGWTNAAMAKHYDHAKHKAELIAAVGSI